MTGGLDGEGGMRSGLNACTWRSFCMLCLLGLRPHCLSQWKRREELFCHDERYLMMRNKKEQNNNQPGCFDGPQQEI